MTRPKSGGGTESVQFKPSSSFTLGSAASSKIKLTDDCNWGAFGVVTLSNGTVLDLNGHSLVVADVDSDYVGTTITNSATSLATLYTDFEPAQSGVSNLCVAARITVAKSSAYVWTGAGGDAKFSTLANWRRLSGAVPSVPPAAGDPLVFAGAGGVVSNDLANLGQAVVQFEPGAGAFTICGNPFTGIPNVVNGSSSVQTFSNAVTFAGTYLVDNANAAVRFPGGAMATYPDPSLRSDFTDVRRRTLDGTFTFTQDWTVPGAPNNAWERPWVIPSGASVTGKKFTGTQGNYLSILQIEAGGRAHFTEMEMGWNKGDFACKGTLVIDGLYVHIVSLNNSGVSRLGRSGSTGTLHANRVEKRRYGHLCEYVTTLVLGSGGLLFTDTSYQPMTFDANTTIRAADDFGILTDFAGDGTDFHGLSLSDRTITINTEDESGNAHTVTFGTSVRAAGGKLRKVGAGTLVMQDGDLASKTGFVKKYTGGTVVEEGTLRVKSSNQLGTGLVELHAGATLEIEDGVTFANDATGGTFRVNGAVTLADGASWHAGTYVFADGAIVTVEPRTTDERVVAKGLTAEEAGHFTTTAGRLVLSDDGELSYVDSFVWVGPDGGRWSDAANWSHNGTTGESAPVSTPGAVVEFANDAALSVTLDVPAACSSLVLGGAGAVTVANPDAATTNALTLYSVTAAGAAANRFECRVEFTEAYNVSLEGVLDFAGGATATAPGDDTFASVHNRTFTGNVAFTSGWKYPRQADRNWPLVVTPGSTLTGTSYTGGQTGWNRILDVQDGATARFNSFEIGWDRGFILVNGTLEVANDFTIVASWALDRGTNHIGWSSADAGILRAAGLVKTAAGATILYVPRYEIGARGVRSPDGAYFLVKDNAPVAIAATANMGFDKGTNHADRVVNVEAGATLTVEPGGHTVTNINLVGGPGTLAVTGTGTATYDAVGGPAAISVGSGATLRIGANVVATNAMALADGATLVLGNGAQAGIVSTPAEGAAVVRTTGTYASPQSVPLGKLAANADVKRLALDPAGITVPQGYRAFLKRSGDNLALRIDKLGAAIIIR